MVVLCNHVAGLTIRIPDPLHSELKETAKRNYRSLNAEILARLSSDADAPRKRKGGKAECPRARFHREGTFCKECGETP